VSEGSSKTIVETPSYWDALTREQQFDASWTAMLTGTIPQHLRFFDGDWWQERMTEELVMWVSNHPGAPTPADIREGDWFWQPDGGR